MLQKVIKYKDYNGNNREETFFFNLNQAEVTEMEMSVAGGMEAMLRRIVSAQDGKQIIKFFKEIILKAYGEKSPDGRRFMKSNELSEAFSQTEAYNQLFMELVTDAKAASAFVAGILPPKEEMSPATPTPAETPAG